MQYLTNDVTSYLAGRYAEEQVRRDMFSATSELAYVAGWMAFDNSEHPIAQRYFTLAVKLAAAADDQPMAGHVLRAMAHQAVDLGHHRQACRLAEASIDGDRYRAACPRERALLGIVRARTLAATGDNAAAASALNRAEDDLAQAKQGDAEPGRVFFFGEASLAHETACTLRDLGDLRGAVQQFRRSVRTRQAHTFTRTHVVTPRLSRQRARPQRRAGRGMRHLVERARRDRGYLLGSGSEDHHRHAQGAITISQPAHPRRDKACRTRRRPPSRQKTMTR